MDQSYGIFKHFAAENPYTSLTKTLNSAATTQATKATMKPLTRKEIRYAHMGQLVIHEGLCYATFLQNAGGDGEEHYSETGEVVLGVFSLEKALSDDFCAENDVTLYKIGSRGETFAGFHTLSIFKCTSMCRIGDLIHILFCVQCEDELFHTFRVAFDIREKKFCRQTAVRLKDGDTEVLMTDEAVNAIYERNGCRRSTSTIVETVSRWSPYQGAYYGSFLIGGTPNNGIVVRTSDFETLELVSVIPYNEKGCAEASSYIFGDILYVACRQDYFIPYMVLNAYDLKTGQWYEPNYLEDGNCRPWFFEKDGELYLINTTEEYYRRYANISRIVRKPMWSPAGVPTEPVATLYDCGFYFAVTEYEGHHYFVSSGPIEQHLVRFGELKLKLHDPEAVNEKLLQAFGE